MMPFSKQLFKNILVVVIMIGLVSCNDKDSKVTYMQQGQQLFRAENYKKAELAFAHVLQTEPENVQARYQMAEALSKQGNYIAAFESYKAVINQDDKHLMARIRAGQLFLLNGQLAEAENMLKQALVLQPDNIETLIFQANVNLVNNNTDAAIVNTEKALLIDKNAASAILMMANIYTKTGKLDHAIQLLQQGLKSSPEHEAMHLLLANLFVKTRQNTQAEKQLIEIIKLKPSHFSAYQQLAVFYMAANEIDKAESIIRKAIANTRKTTAQLYLIDFLVQKRNIDVALAELLPMIDQQQTNFPLQFKLVSLYLNKGDVESAIIGLKDIIALDESGEAGIKAKNTLANMYLSAHKIQQAEKLISEVLLINPNNIQALMIRGQIALSKNEKALAIADFRQILTLQVNNLHALKLLAAVHVSNGDNVLAIENLAKIVALKPEDNVARQDLAALLIANKQSKQAEQHVAVLLNQNASNKKALELLFKIRLQNKDWEAAQQISQLFLQDPKNEALGHYMSGLAYQAEGKWTESIKSFKHALTIQSDAIEPLTQLINSYLALNKDEKAISYLKKINKKSKDNFIAYNLLGDLFLKNHQLDNAEKAFRQAIKIKPEWAQNYRNIASLQLLKGDKKAAVKILQKGLDKTNSAASIVNDLAALDNNN